MLATTSEYAVKGAQAVGIGPSTEALEEISTAVGKKRLTRKEKQNKRAKNLAKSQKFNEKWEKVKQLREQQKEGSNNK